MKLRLVHLFFAVFLITASALPAHADEWTNQKDWIIDYAKSSLTFSGKLADKSIFNGRFKSFQVVADLSPDAPESGRFSAVIDLNSATTGDGQRDSMLPQPEWFDTAKYPQARFTSDSITLAGNDIDLHKVYEAKGTLVIKGFKQKVTLPFTLVQEGDVWHIKGSLKLRRNDFNVGEGQYANESTVMFIVTVNVDLIARPNF